MNLNLTRITRLPILPFLAALPALSAQERLHPDFAELGARWAGAIDALDIPGMAVVVLEGEEILHLQTFGVRDVVERTPVTPDTQFYIASITKTFVAFAMQQMVSDGLVDLDAPVKRYLPRLRLADDDMEQRMTVRDLLCHRPGLRSFPAVFLDAYTGEITEDRYYHFLAEEKPTGEVEYSNVHFTLAGRVLESVTGTSWKEVLEQQIFEPAGMTRTTADADAMYADPNVAFPTVWSNGALRPSTVRKSNATMHAAGGLGTSISDLARWIGLQLAEGRASDGELLGEDAIAEMLTFQSRDASWADRGIVGFGLGWMLGQFEGERTAQHGGGYVGSSASVTFLPDLRLGVAVLVNTDGAGGRLCSLVTEDVLAHLLVTPRSDPLPALVAQWKQRRDESSAGAPQPSSTSLEGRGISLAANEYVGEYQNTHWGSVHIAVENERFSGRIGNIRFSLHPLGLDRFSSYATGSLDFEFQFLVARGEVVGLTTHIEDYEVEFTR